MTHTADRLHIDVAGDTARTRGIRRGEALRATLGEALVAYERLFRAAGVSEEAQRAGAEQVLDNIEAWRPAFVEELAGVASGSGLSIEAIAALNARTEILALGRKGAAECSTVTAVIDGRRIGAQTWDWHVELDPFWHTQRVSGTKFAFAGLTEQGILSKIGVNSAGLALHFNILGHAADGTTGIPMHVLSAAVLSECATVDEAIELVRQAPIGSSSSFTMLDANRAVSLEISPVGVYEFEERDGSVQRMNHFLSEEPLSEQKSELYEPDSSERLSLVRSRLAHGLPDSEESLIRLLESAEGEAPLTCRPDMALPFGEHWATLATIVTDPEARAIRILDGMPPEAETGTWRALEA